MIKNLNKLVLNSSSISSRYINTLSKRSIFTSSIKSFGRYNSSNNNDTPTTATTKSRLSNDEYQYQQERMRYEQGGNNGLIFNQDIKSEQKEKLSKEKDQFITKPLIYNVNLENFNDVTMESKQPVIINCYSNKGDLSKLSNEALEAYAKEYAGCFVVAKLNVDDNIQLAGALKIQSLPTMFILYQKQVIQQFIGLPNHEALEDIIQKVIKLSGGLIEGKTIDQQQLLAEQYIKNNQDDKALEIYKLLMDKDTTQTFRTLLGLVQCYTNLNNEDMVKETLLKIKEKFPNEMDHRKIAICKRILDLKKEVSLAVQQYKDTPVSQFENKIASTPNDLDSKYDVSLLYYQHGQYEKSINQLLDIIKQNKKYTRSNNPDGKDSAKNLLIKIFDSLDSQDPMIIKSRNKLNNIWFS